MAGTTVHYAFISSVNVLALKKKEQKYTNFQIIHTFLKHEARLSHVYGRIVLTKYNLLQ